MGVQHYPQIFLVLTFFWISQAVPMQSEEEINIDEIRQALKTTNLQKQKNFKKICFGFIDDKYYEYNNKSLLECAGYLKKILLYLKLTKHQLFLDLIRLCICQHKKLCESCFKTENKLLVSNSKAIKALKEISYNKTFVISETGTLTKENQHLLFKIIEICGDTLRVHFVEEISKEILLK